MSGILLIVVVVCVASFLLFTKSGKRLQLRASGTAEEVIAKDASTPEGAKAYYNTAISKKKNDYENANLIYTQMLGKISTYEEQLRSMQKENMQLNLKINTCIDKNDDDGAKVYLKKQQDTSEKIEIVKNALKELQEKSVLQKENVDRIYSEWEDLKAEKENAVLALETAQVTKALQATPGMSSNETDAMLEKVRDGVRKTREEAEGSRIAYENSSGTQQQRLEKRMRDSEIDRRLQELKSNRRK